MARIGIGTEVYMSPYFGGKDFGRPLEEKKYPGKVIYINHKGRFFTVEFQLPYGKLRESFKFDGR